MRLIGGTGNKAQTIAKGFHATSSIIGQAIPVIYGRYRAPGILVYATNFKVIKGEEKKGTTAKGRLTGYKMDVDLLLGYGPMQGSGALYFEKTNYLPGNFHQTFTGTGPATVFNFTVNNVPQTSPDGTTDILITVLGVTYQKAFSTSYTDYGNAQGTVTYSGTADVPLYNGSYPGPNEGDWTTAGIPYALYNDPVGSTSVTVVFPTPQTGISVTVYYQYSRNINGNVFTPLSAIPLDFEKELGINGINVGAYVEFSGVSGTAVDLGVANMMPNYNFEPQGLFGYGKNSDCNPADIIADIICSGNYIQGWAGTFPPPVWQHGLNLTSFTASDANGGIPSTGPYNPAYARYGGILDDEPNFWGPTYGGGTNLGLNSLRNYCQAAGIYLSYRLDSQQTAATILDDLCAIANSAPCWDGAQLKFIPYCEQSFSANGADYTSPTSSGPVATINDDDFITTTKDGKPKPPVELSYQRSDQNYNSLVIEYTDRSYPTSNDGNPVTGLYNTNQVIIADQADITAQGPMPGSSLNYLWITDEDVATNVGWAILRRSILVNRKTYKWRTSPKFTLLSLMDLLLIIEPSFPKTSIDQTAIPVKITKITENPDLTLDIEAEPFVYGSSFPAPPAVAPIAGGGGSTSDQNLFGGTVNAPIIFEAIPAIATKAQIWIATSGPDPNYGGCTIWLSTDGGLTYLPKTRLFGKNTMGKVYSSNYPSHADPDSVNTLNVDLTESLGTLSTFTTAQRDIFNSLCYLAGGGTITSNGQTLTIPYELVAYATANLSAANKYALVPTIRRGVYGTPIAAHNIGSDFSYLNDGEIFQLDLDPAWIGTTLYFKFTAFNIFGGNEQPIANVTAYPFTPTGQVGFSVGYNYTVAPTSPLYQGKAGGWSGVLNADGTTDTNASTWTDPTKVYFPGLFANFTNPTRQLKYAARDSGLAAFSNSAGGQQAWVTIFDPGLLGEPTGAATLTASADLNQTKWNTPGYIRVGTLTSVQYASGGGGGTGGGGGSQSSPGPYIIAYDEGDGSQPISSEILLRHEVPSDINNVVLPANLVGSAGGSRTAPTGTFTITIKRSTNGGTSFTTIGTATIAAATKVMSFTFSADVTLNPGDLVDFVAQSGLDSTISGIFWSIAGQRT